MVPKIFETIGVFQVGKVNTRFQYEALRTGRTLILSDKESRNVIAYAKLRGNTEFLSYLKTNFHSTGYVRVSLI